MHEANLALLADNPALLADRGVVAVTGEDALRFLGGIVTNDVGLLDRQPAIFAGLLSPQGKILFDFLIVKVAGGALLDVARDEASGLVARLRLYRLRSKVEIEDLSAGRRVVAGWPAYGGRDVPRGEPPAVPASGSGSGHDASFPDPRAAGLGTRRIVATDTDPVRLADAARYHAHRIALGVPDGGRDYDYGDTYPHEANFDLLHGVSFDKGCYVGQEVVARMQHKTVVRKRVVKVTGASELPSSRPEIKAGEVVLGKLGSVAGREGLALLRLDRVLELRATGAAITADGIALDVEPAALARYAALTVRGR